MSEEPRATLFDALGEDGLARVVAAFYRRIPEDDLLGPMYPPDDFAGAEQRLRDFLVFRTGGPQRYIQERGHPRLRMRHAPFAVTQAARDRWVQHMEAAIEESEVHPAAAEALSTFLGDVATFLINRR